MLEHKYLPGLCFNKNEWKNNHLYSTYLDSTMFKFNCSEGVKQISNQNLIKNNEITLKKKTKDGDFYLLSEFKASPGNW